MYRERFFTIEELIFLDIHNLILTHTYIHACIDTCTCIHTYIIHAYSIHACIHINKEIEMIFFT